MVKFTELELAEQQVIEIANYLKENFPKKKVSKMSLKVKFRLPQNRSAIIWHLLKKEGFAVTLRYIIVP